MKRFTLPKKLRLKSVLRLFFLINFVFFITALFYFSSSRGFLTNLFSEKPDEAKNEEEVLSVAVGPMTLRRINVYNLAPGNNTPRPVTTFRETRTNARINNARRSVIPSRGVVTNSTNTSGAVVGIFSGGSDNGKILPSSPACNTTIFSSFVLPAGCEPFVWYESPPLLEVWGDSGSQIPVLFYSGGVYQVKSGPAPEVKLVSRLYSTQNGVYRHSSNPDVTCTRDWYPQSVVKDIRDRMYFGHSSLSFNSNSGCFGLATNQTQFYKGYNTQGDPNGKYADPWQFHYQLTFTKDNSNNLLLDQIYTKANVSKEGLYNAATFTPRYNPSHQTYCYGKDLEGRCRQVVTHRKQFRNPYEWNMFTGNNTGNLGFDSYFHGTSEFNSQGRRISCDVTEEMSNLSEGYCGRPETVFNSPFVFLWDTSFGNLCKVENFTSTPFVRRSSWAPDTGCMGDFTGFDMPLVFYNNNRAIWSSFSHSQPYSNASFNSKPRDITAAEDVAPWIFYGIRVFGFWGGTGDSLKYDLQWPVEIAWNGFEYQRPQRVYDFVSRNDLIRIENTTIADFASDAYQFKVLYSNNVLEVLRFGQWQADYLGPSNTRNVRFPNNNIVGYASISVPNLHTKNVSFNISGQGDLDILFAPTAKEVRENPRVVFASRMFRVPKFNYVNPQNLTYSGNESTYAPIYQMNDHPNGYSLPTGQDAPLSFKYVNTGKNPITDDYAVFSSLYSVWLSNIPYGCTLNSIEATVATDPSSRLNGVDNPNSGTYSLNIGLTAAPVITCGNYSESPRNLRLKLVDRFNSFYTYPSIDLVMPNSGLNLTANINQNINFRAGWDARLFVVSSTGQEFPVKFRVNSNFVFNFIEEGNVTLNMLKKNSSGQSVAYNDAVFTVEQFSALGTGFIIPNRRGVVRVQQNSSNVRQLTSNSISGFYYDHSLRLLSNNRPFEYGSEDQIITRVCFEPTSGNTFQQNNLAIDNFITTGFSNTPTITLSCSPGSPSGCLNRCLEVRHRSGPLRYGLPNGTINVTLKGVDLDNVNMGESSISLNGSNYIEGINNINPYIFETQPATDTVKKAREGIILSKSAVPSELKGVQISGNFFELSFGRNFSTSTSMSTQIKSGDNCPASLNYITYFDAGFNKNCKLNDINSTKPWNLIILNQAPAFELNLNSNSLPIIDNFFILKNRAGTNASEKNSIKVNLDCSVTPTPTLCSVGARYHIRGGFYGLLDTGTSKVPATQTGQSSTKVTFVQSPDILPELQKFLYNNKTTIISQRKVRLNYK